MNSRAVGPGEHIEIIEFSSKNNSIWSCMAYSLREDETRTNVKSVIITFLRKAYMLYCGAVVLVRRRAFHPYEMRNYERTYKDCNGGYVMPFKTLYMRFARAFKLPEPQVNYASVEAEVGNFYYSLARLIKPEYILETGSARGYSTCCLASALEQNHRGIIYTIDPLNIEHFWDYSSLRKRIIWIRDVSQNAFPHVQKLTFDILVLDSDHHYETIMSELILYEPLLKSGGYIMIHDCLFFDGVGLAVQQLIENERFQAIISATPRTHGDVKPARSPGLAVIQKIRHGDPPLYFDEKYRDQYIGDTSTPPLLKTYSTPNYRNISVTP